MLNIKNEPEDQLYTRLQYLRAELVNSQETCLRLQREKDQIERELMLREQRRK